MKKIKQLTVCNANDSVTSTYEIVPFIIVTVGHSLPVVLATIVNKEALICKLDYLVLIFRCMADRKCLPRSKSQLD